MNDIQLAELPFPHAAELWLDQHQHQRSLKPNTIRNYKACIKLLVANTSIHKYGVISSAQSCSSKAYPPRM